MRFHELSIPGVWRIEAEPFRDERGILRRHFCTAEFAAHGLAVAVAQGNISENLRPYTLRGLHYQDPPRAEAKTVSCLHGSIQAVVADLRPESLAYLQWVDEELTAENRRSIHVPPGCAMGFLTLEDNTLLHYYMSEPFAPRSYKGIRFNDPALGIVWAAAPSVISDKDRTYPDFRPVSR